MTSTYPLPFLLFLTVPPFRACGTPIKSSMVLALLIAVPGLDGGADGGANRPSPVGGAKVGAAGVSPLVCAGDSLRPGEEVVRGLLPGSGPMFTGGVLVPGSGGTGGTFVGTGGGPAPLTALLGGGALGGGGVGLIPTAEASSPPFPLIHFLRSLS